MAVRKPPGKGLMDKRARIVRSLAAHVAWLEVCARMAPYRPAPRTWQPRPRQTPEEWAARWEAYAPVRYVSPRERPALAHPCAGPEAVTDEEIAAWVAEDLFVRSGLRPATARAMCFIAQFAPAPEPRP